MFSLDQNGNIVYLSGNEVGWSDTWTIIEGLSSNPPSVIAWDSNSRLDVFYVSSLHHNVLTSYYQNGIWSNWQDLGSSIARPVVLCSLNETINVPGERIDQWAIDTSTGEIMHNFYQHNVSAFYSPGESATWQMMSQNGTRRVAGTPAISCRHNPDGIYDMLIYGNDNRSVQINQYIISKGGYQGWIDLGGNFIGDPVVLNTGPQRFDFFGIGNDSAMYHISWRNATQNITDYSPLRSLGGSFASVPSAVVTGEDRIDVLALGLDGKLKHRTMFGSIWSRDWENLGIVGNSAPLLTDLKNGSVGVFLLGENNRLQYAQWESSDTSSWTSLIWRDLGGNLAGDR